MDCDIVAVIEAQLAAYNRHDAAAFAETYAPDAEVYWHPNVLRLKGRAQIEASYGETFRKFPTLKATILHRTVLDGWVIDEERAERAPGQALHAVVAYRVRGCLIERADIIRDEPAK